jgi:beta-1,4-mannooligosaccharide phosphorylase
MRNPLGRIAFIAALAMSLAGCGAAPPATTPATAPTQAAASATPLPTASDAPAVTQRFEFGDEAIVDTALIGTNDKYVNPGAVIEVDGVLHMFANSFSSWPDLVRVAHLTSEDGVAWDLDDGAELLGSDDSEMFPMADPGIDVSTGYVADDGTWVLFFETVQRGRPWEVWRMTAPAPQGPWTVDDTPTLPVGEAGAFDVGGVQWPSIVRVGDRWAMYYTGLGAAGRGSGVIGVAFSDDGVTWAKESAPALVATEDWEFGQLDRPRVVAADGGLVMVYAGLDLTKRGLATSTDGLTWTKVAGPNIEPSDFPVVGGSWDAALLHRGGELEYFLEIGQATTKIYRSTLAWP